jgi:AAA ATPase domain
MDPADNPYTPSAGATPPALVGRKAELDTFGTALTRLSQGRHARSMVLSGLRGVGKTVLLNEFDKLAREHGWITSGAVECNEDDRLGPLIARLVHRSLRRLSKAKRAGHAIERALGVLRAFSLSLDEAGRPALRIDVEAVKGVADSGDAEADIVELFTELGTAAAAQNAGVAMLLDEMQYLQRDDLALISAVFHRVSQDLSPIMLVGAGLPQLPLILRDAKPYNERLFSYRMIESLAPPAARQALLIPAARRGIEFDPRAVEIVLGHSEGYPYFLQQWGETIWNDVDSSPVTIADVNDAQELVADELDRRFFRDRYESCTEAERIYVAAMADIGDGPHSSSQIAAHMGRRLSDVSVRRDGLIKKGIIFNPADSDLDFTVPKFAEFVRRVHPFDPAERPRRGRKPRQ